MKGRRKLITRKWFAYQKRAAIRSALILGELSGDPRPFDVEKFKQTMQERSCEGSQKA